MTEPDPGAPGTSTAPRDDHEPTAALPAVSFVMPVINEAEHIEAAVRSVLAQAYPSDTELILALGPSTDGTDDVVARVQAGEPRLRAIANPDGTIPAALNGALAAARHPVVIRVDAHTELAPGYAQDGVRTLLDTGATIVGGVMAAQGRTPWQQAVAWAYRSRIGIGGPAYHVGGEAGPAESAYLGIFRRDDIVGLGGYEPEILRGEDWNLCRRIREQDGLVWFDPLLRVTYWPRTSLRRLSHQFLATGTWRGHLTRRDPGSASARYFVPPVTVAAIAAGSVLGVLGQPLGWVPLAGYVLVVVGVSATARPLSPAARLRLAAVLPTMHLVWGAGFWKGVLLGASGTQDRGRV